VKLKDFCGLATLKLLSICAASPIHKTKFDRVRHKILVLSILPIIDNFCCHKMGFEYPKEKRDHLLSPTITKYDGVVTCFDAFSIHGWAIVESYVLEGHFEAIIFLKLQFKFMVSVCFPFHFFE